MSSKITKQIKGKKLLDIYKDIAKPNVYVTRMVLRVDKNGDVEVVEAEISEVT